MGITADFTVPGMDGTPVTLSKMIKGHKYLLLDFWASWCGPCRMMAPQFELAAKQLPQVRFAKVDTDSEPQTASEYGIRSIPTIIVFNGGHEVARQAGAMRAPDILRWINATLAQ